MKKILIGLSLLALMVTISISPVSADADGIVEELPKDLQSLVGTMTEDGTIITQEMVDAAPKPGTLKFVFFSEPRTNPYSEAELEHEYTEKDSLPWGVRVAGCESLSSWGQYHDCMFRPWSYGF